MSQKSRFKSGLTWRSILAMLVAIFIFIPVSCYLNLTVGAAGGAAMAATFVMIIIFSEITRYFGKPLTKQELFIMFSVISFVTAIIPPYYWLIWRAWYARHPVFHQVHLLGKPLTELIPSWFVPKESHVLESRTFFQLEWAIPLIINSSMVILTFLQSVSLALLFGYIFVEVEKLEFPMGQVQASLISTLSERNEQRMRIFVFAIGTGAVLGAFVYIPQIMGAPLVPLPWADFTPWTGDIIPGAIIGLSTDPTIYVTGMVIPLNVALCALISSFVVYILMNHLFLTVFTGAFPKWVSEFFSRMKIATLQYRSYLRIWLPIQFGFTVGMALFYILVIRKEIVRSLKLLVTASRGSGPSETVFPSLYIILALFFSSSIASLILFLYLVPGYPAIVAAVITLGYTFLAALITSRALAIGAVAPVITWPWRIVTAFTGYKGFTAWDFTPAIGGYNSATIVQSIKVAYLTETKPMDYVKLLSAGFIVALFLSLVFYDFFWRIAPIPSSVYPFTMLFWPQYMLEVLLFSTGQIVINPEVVIASIIISMAIVAAERGLGKFGIAFSAIGIIIGIFQIPPVAIAFLIGSVLSNIVMPKIWPAWKEQLYMIMGGVVAGLSISIGIGIATSLLMKSPWIWPW